MDRRIAYSLKITTVAAAAIGTLLSSAVLNARVVLAAQVKLLAAEVLKPALTELTDQFERSTGHKLTIVYDSAGRVRSRLVGGELTDAVVIQRPAAEALADQNLVQRESIVTVGRSGVGAAVPKGAPKPDIGTADGLKRALLAAASIAYPDPGAGAASGILFSKIIARLGIAQEVNAKAKLMTHTFADFAAHDEAQLVITQPMDILAVPSYDLVGWLPKELQEPNNFTWAAAVTTHAAEPQAAQALVQFLSSPAARSVIKAKGMQVEG